MDGRTDSEFPQQQYRNVVCTEVLIASFNTRHGAASTRRTIRMCGILASSIMGFGSLMLGTFGGFLDILFMPMWTMMAGWFGLF